VHIFIIIFFILFLYGAFSTIFPSNEIVGEIGKIYGEGNIELFGYLAYIDLLLLLYPLYKLYKNEAFAKDVEFYIGWTLFFISLIIFQTLVVNIYYSGSIGLIVYEVLYPNIGKAGMWLLWLLSTLISMVLILDEIPDGKVFVSKIQGYFQKLKAYLKPYWNRAFANVENPFFDKTSTDNMTTIVAQRRVRKKIRPKTPVKQKTPKKIVHKKRLPKVEKELPSIHEEEILLEDRPLEDIDKINPFMEEELYFEEKEKLLIKKNTSSKKTA
jgi:S-DNA-T family DNA segregation ATPase FtsK/SpoIIIE